MIIRMLIAIILTTGCGPEIKLKNKLESVLPLTNEQKQSFQKSGILIRKAVSEVTYNNKKYKVSIYSSKNASDFIKTIPLNSEVPIVFTGGTKGNEIVLETVVRQ